MSLWRIFQPKDPLESQVSMIVKSAVRWERKYPGRPIHESLGPMASSILRRVVPEGTDERLSLDSIVEADPPITDTREFCCAALEVLTGVTPDKPQEYARIVELVDRELAKRRGG